MSKRATHDDDLVVAAQRGDRGARERVVREHLPLVYNVVGRALGADADAEDVVQETMLQVVRHLERLRRPDSVRAWILAIAVQQIGAHQRRSEAAPMIPLDAVPESGAEFEEVALLRVRLSGERRRVAEAVRWLDADDRTVLALWWQETGGRLTRDEVAHALETTPAYAAVRIQRMRAQLDRSRSVVTALGTEPRCPGLTETVAGWDGVPSPLWRKRIDRHVRDCPACLSTSRDGIAVERLLVGAALIPVPAALTAAVISRIAASGTLGGRPRQLSQALRAKPLAAGVSVLVALVGGIFAYGREGVEQEQPTANPVVIAARTTDALPTPSATTPSVTATTSKPTPSPREKAATCGAGLAKIWANWPVPTDKGSYTDLGDGTVRDRKTCLVWQKAIAPKSYTFTGAKSYCAGLTLDGGGWHLPSRVELLSIADYAEANPAVNEKAFPDTPPRYFWTSSPWAVTKTPLRAWIVNFYEGLTSNAGDQTGEYSVRCVRSDGGSGRPSYQIRSGQVTDPATGLTWQRGVSTPMAVGKAAAYCTGLDLGGRTWRLPTLKELETTVDETRVSPAIDVKAFPATPKTGAFWSATTSAAHSPNRWLLTYNDGITTAHEVDEAYVRCVS
ncbi:sigma-70 family RNA polymerase sigma factor [Actinoplanes sp. NPDC051851]|uniref:sigma-70 family RNA polymerase sigma factor n=1 Tax=Actinoplanes sp. NPDC051851 TaxID=3154753 RepID=UPI00343C7ACE